MYEYTKDHYHLTSIPRQHNHETAHTTLKTWKTHELQSILSKVNATNTETKHKDGKTSPIPNERTSDNLGLARLSSSYDKEYRRLFDPKTRKSRTNYYNKPCSTPEHHDT